MSEREELLALRRLAELEAKAAGGAPDFAAQAAGMSPIDLSVARSKNDAFGGYLREQAKAPKPGETPEQTDKRLYGSLGYEKPGVAEGALRSAYQGFTYGGGDEAVAAIAATLDPLRNGDAVPSTWGQRYDNALSSERGKLRQFRDAYPVTSTIAEVGGALPTALMLPMGAPAATLGGRVVAGATSGALQGGLYGALAGEGEGRVKEAERGALLGGGIGGAAPVVGAGVRKLSDRLAANRFIANAPETDALEYAGNRAFDAADAIAPMTPQNEFQQFVARVKPVLWKEGLDPTMTPKASGVLARFEDEALAGSGPNGQLPQMDTLRRIAASVARSNDADERRIGKILLREFEGMIDNVSPQYGQALSDANQAWSQFKKSQLLDDAMERGSRAASGVENGIRIEFNKILNNPKLRRGLSPEQVAAMEQVVEGTIPGNILRRVGKFSPGTGRQGSALISTLGGGLGAAGTGALTGSTLLGAAGAVAVPAVGYGAQKLAEASTVRSANLARALAATGASAPPAANPALGRYASMLMGQSGPYSAQLRELLYQ